MGARDKDDMPRRSEVPRRLLPRTGLRAKRSGSSTGVRSWMCSRCLSDASSRAEAWEGRAWALVDVRRSCRKTCASADMRPSENSSSESS